MTAPEKPLAAETSRPRRIGLAAECIALFAGAPLFFFFHATRWNVHAALWLIALYALFTLRCAPGFSWRGLWHGKGWPVAQRKIALARYGLATAALILFAAIIAPARLLTFPMQRPGFWLLVMVLYPILSCVPQELVFRSFFFRRYAPLFRDEKISAGVSAIFFGFVHIVFHNPVSPLLSFIGGLFIGHSYLTHRSLKWAAIEHAAYGCMVFTVGLGHYFLVGGLRL